MALPPTPHHQPKPTVLVNRTCENHWKPMDISSHCMEWPCNTEIIIRTLIHLIAVPGQKIGDGREGLRGCLGKWFGWMSLAFGAYHGSKVGPLQQAFGVLCLCLSCDGQAIATTQRQELWSCHGHQAVNGNTTLSSCITHCSQRCQLQQRNCAAFWAQAQEIQRHATHGWCTGRKRVC